MRYFQTSNASRGYITSGLAFNFSPTEQIGGSWQGVLAVEDDSVASQLAAAAFPQVKEITREEYEEAQKKTPLKGGFVVSRIPLRPLPPVVGRADGKPASASSTPEPQKTAVQVTAGPLKTTQAQPPEEAILISGKSPKAK